MSFFENTRKPVGLGGKLMVAMMNLGHSPVARWGLQFLNAAPDAKVLDCGCGGGANMKRLLKKYPQGIVKGIDYSPVSVEKTKKVNETAIAEGRCAVLQGSVADMIFADDWFDAVTAFETLYFWPDLPQAAVRGLQQAVLEETDGPGICAGERRLGQMARLRDDDCALRKRQAHLSCPLASPFRTSPRERSAPCRSGRRARARAGRFSAACSPARWSLSEQC